MAVKNLYPDDELSRKVSEDFSFLYNIIRSLRGPNGCPWDREQTPLSLRNALLEEANEAVEAINHSDHEHIQEVLGDVLLVLMLIAYIEEQEEKFSVHEMIAQLSEKLIRRHPHVFGEGSLQSSQEVLIQWDRIKAVNEGRGKADSALDTVPKHLHHTDRAYKLQKKASKEGFDWQDYRGVIEKIREELDEVEDVILQIEESGEDIENISDERRQALEQEIGDLMFSSINLSRKTGIHPNDALSRTNSKFYSRFTYVEEQMKAHGMEMSAEHLDQMERFWLEAKEREQAPTSP
jgi:tetrapyrrole methylase family protein/MazG family protein